MSDGASPSPCLTLNAISPTAVRLVFSADEAVAASATSASVDKTVIERRKPLGTSIDPTTHEVLALRAGRHKPPLTALTRGGVYRNPAANQVAPDANGSDGTRTCDPESRFVRLSLMYRRRGKAGGIR